MFFFKNIAWILQQVCKISKDIIKFLIGQFDLIMG